MGGVPKMTYKCTFHVRIQKGCFNQRTHCRKKISDQTNETRMVFHTKIWKTCKTILKTKTNSNRTHSKLLLTFVATLCCMRRGCERNVEPDIELWSDFIHFQARNHQLFQSFKYRLHRSPVPVVTPGFVSDLGKWGGDKSSIQTVQYF